MRISDMDENVLLEHISQQFDNPNWHFERNRYTEDGPLGGCLWLDVDSKKDSLMLKYGFHYNTYQLEVQVISRHRRNSPKRTVLLETIVLAAPELILENSHEEPGYLKHTFTMKITSKQKLASAIEIGKKLTFIAMSVERKAI